MAIRPNPRFIEKSWQQYRSRVIPLDATRLEVQTARDSFYTGVMTLYRGLMLGFDWGTEPTDNDIQMMDDVHDEMRKYKADCEFRLSGGVKH